MERSNAKGSEYFMVENLEDPNYYIFVTRDRRSFDIELSALEIIGELLSSGIWLMGKRSRNRQHLKSGDAVIFYAAGPANSIFIATATIGSSCALITAKQKQAINKVLLDELSLEYPNLYGIKVESAGFFSKPVKVRELLDQLGFIKNRKRWGLHFYGSSVKIPRKDFELILRKGKPFVKKNSKQT